ncbi:Uncharacterised protein [uncultured archaeon]|nr:Uncharacterised protein [uncultured archaeon]
MSLVLFDMSSITNMLRTIILFTCQTQATMNKEFEITNILTLKTHNLHGKRLDRYDYGGPLALLRLIQYVKTK